MSPIVKYSDGTQIKFSGEPTPDMVEQAYTQSQGGNDPVSATLKQLSASLTPPPQPQTQSPLSLGESIKFGMADDIGREEMLKERYNFVERTPDGNYAVGDIPQSMQLVNPQGIFNDIPAKLAQHITDINVIAGGIAGAVIGTAVAPGPGTAAGAIAGSAIGGGAASLSNKLVSKALGLNHQTPGDVAVDVVLDTALMGVGEGLGQALNIGLKAAGKGVAKKGIEMAEQLARGTSLPAEELSKRMDIFAKVVSFTSGWKEEEVKTALVNGARATFDTDTTGVLAGIKKGSNEHAVKVLDLIKSGVSKKEGELNFAVGKAARELADKVGGRSLPGIDLQNNAIHQLERMRFGKIVSDNAGNISFNLHSNLNADELKVANKIIKYFEAFGGKTYKVSNRDIRLFTEETAKTNIDDLLRGYNGIETDIQTAINQNNGSLSEALINLKKGNNVNLTPGRGNSVKGITDYIDDLAKEANYKEYSTAKAAFKEFSDLKDEAMEAGLDITKKGGWESIAKHGFKSSPRLENVVRALDTYMGEGYSNMLSMWKSANSAAHAMPNMLRFGMVMSLAGLGALKSEGLPGKVASIGAGLALGTPLGMSKVLRGMERIGVLKTSSTKAVSKGEARMAKMLLKQLLTKVPAQAVSRSFKTEAGALKK